MHTVDINRREIRDRKRVEVGVLCHSLRVPVLFVFLLAFAGCCTEFHRHSNTKGGKPHQNSQLMVCVGMYHMDWATRLAIRGEVHDRDAGEPLKGVKVALESELLVGHAQTVVLPECSDQNGTISTTYEAKWGCEMSEEDVKSSRMPHVDLRVILSLEGYGQREFVFSYWDLPDMGDDYLVDLGSVTLERK